MANPRPRLQQRTLSENVGRGQIQWNMKHKKMTIGPEPAKKIERILKMLDDVQQEQHIKIPLVQFEEVTHLERNISPSVDRPEFFSIWSDVIPQKLGIGKNLPQFRKNSPGTTSNLTYG
jgi:hypothetical protein